MAKQKRIKLFIDRRVQGALVLRTLLYWFCCMTTVTAMLIVWRIVGGGPARVFYQHFGDLWHQYSAPLIASTILLPLVIIDLVRMSNRFVGPIFRLRRVLHDMASGIDVTNVSFRDGDYWREIAEDLNKVASRLREQKAVQTTSADASANVASKTPTHGAPITPTNVTHGFTDIPARA